MRIGIYIENYIAGGVETVILNKIISWPSKKDEFIIIYNKECDGFYEIFSKKELNKINYKLSNIITIETLRHQFPFWSKIIRIFGYWLRHILTIINFINLKKNFSQLDLDFLIIHNGGYPGAYSSFSAILASKVIGLPKPIYVIHNLPGKIKFLQLPFEKIYDLLINNYSKIVCVSRVSAELMLNYRFINKLPSIIHNGIQKPQQNKKIVKNNDNVINIAMVGRFDKNKGHFYFLKAMQILQSQNLGVTFKINIFGKLAGEKPVDVKKIVLDLDLARFVVFHGFVDNVQEKLKTMDLLVLPSTGWESLPMVILEAMSVGLPVIASDVGGIKELVDDQVTGFLIPPKDITAIKKALETLIKSEKLRLKLSKNAFKKFDYHFTSQKMSNHYRNLLLL